MNTRVRLLIFGILILGICIIGYAFLRPGGNTPQNDQANNANKNQGDQDDNESLQADPEYVMVGGVRRKASDVRKPKDIEKSPLNDEESNKRPRGYGKTPPVPFDANPNVKSVTEAIRKRNHPERISPLAPSTPFDAEAYAKNPQAYLDVVEPGRVFAPAQPGKGVPRIRPLSPRFQKVEQGGSVKLRVTGKPGMPVTFTSFDLGQFSNQLTSISVVVNDQGIAETEFFATPGTVNDVRIMAASPATSGQAQFVIAVHLQDKAGT